MTNEKENEGKVEIVEEKQENTIKAKPAESDVKDELSAPELEMAKKHDLLKKEGEADVKKEEEKQEDIKKEEEQKEKKVEEKKESLSEEEKEHEMLKDYNKNEQGLYFKQKKETRKRQQAEIDRDMTQTKLKYAEEQITELKGRIESVPKKKDDLGDEDLGDILEDEKGKGNVLTVEKYNEIEAEKAKKTNEVDQKKVENSKKADAIKKRVIEQGEEAKLEHADFDKTMDLTMDLLKNHETLFAGKSKQIYKVKRLYKDWCLAVANSLDPNQEETAADIAYELGQMHPKYGNNAEDNGESGNSDKTDKTDEKVARMLDNAGKKVSSASVTGSGGRRLVSYEDLTLADLATMSRDKYAKLPREVRERVLRGG